MYRLGLFNVEVWTLAWPTDFISRTQWLVFPSFIYLLIHKVEVLNSNSTLYCSFVFCGLCLWCFAQNTTHTTHQCEVVFLSRRFNSWKLHIFLQLSVVQVFGVLLLMVWKFHPLITTYLSKSAHYSLFSHWQEKSTTSTHKSPQPTPGTPSIKKSKVYLLSFLISFIATQLW